MKFSIIMPVYNNAAYLEAALNSVLMQTWTDWEAICVDDGSTDQSGDILDRYSVLDARIKVRHQANAGVGKARNAALDIATGDWVCFLDGDDLVGKDWLKNVALTINKSPALDWVRTGYCTFESDNAGTPVDVKKCPVPCDYYMDVSAAIRGYDLVGGQGLMTLNFWRRAIVAEARFPETITIREDALFALQIVPKIKQVATIAACDYFYRQTDNSASHGKRPYWEGDKFQKMLNEMWPLYANQPGASVAFARLAIKNFQYWGSHAYCSSCKQIRQLRANLWRAVISGGLKLNLLSFGSAMRLVVFMAAGILMARGGCGNE